MFSRELDKLYICMHYRAPSLEVFKKHVDVAVQDMV